MKLDIKTKTTHEVARPIENADSVNFELISQTLDKKSLENNKIEW